MLYPLQVFFYCIFLLGIYHSLASRLIFMKNLLLIGIRRGKMQILTISLASPHFLQNAGKVVDRRRLWYDGGKKE